MAHIGSDGSGHYRAGLKLRPAVTNIIHPVQWLLTDDWRQPETIWQLPEWFLSNLTMAWLVRTDMQCLPFPQHQPQMDQMDNQSLTQLLDMLAAPDLTKSLAAAAPNDSDIGRPDANE